MNSNLRVATFGDIHLGHPHTLTGGVLANLRAAFPNNEETGMLDLILIEGDVFDRSLSLADNNSLDIKLWVNSFLRMCKQRDIVVRILEGTPSHDWCQSKIFISSNETGLIGADVKYVDKLSIEYIERFDLSVLYVPDEWHAETDETWKQVTVLLKDHGLEQVDIALMHGAFAYQLPSFVQVPTHDPDRYLSVVRHLIYIGHIHKHSQYERIIAAGSFDRVSHGEEEAKGWILTTLRSDGKHDIEFVENKGAKVYKSINCCGLTIEQALAKIAKAVDNVPNASYMRIIADKEDAIVTSISEMYIKYPLFTWTTKISTKGAAGKEALVDVRARVASVSINQSNIVELLMKRINERDISPQLAERCRLLLGGIT